SGTVLDARAHLQAYVHQDLTRIDRREEVATEHRHQQERGQNGADKADYEHAAVTERELQQRMIVAPDAFESCLETTLKSHQRIAGLSRRGFSTCGRAFGAPRLCVGRVR